MQHNILLNNEEEISLKEKNVNNCIKELEDCQNKIEDIKFHSFSAEVINAIIYIGIIMTLFPMLINTLIPIKPIIPIIFYIVSKTINIIYNGTRFSRYSDKKKLLEEKVRLEHKCNMAKNNLKQTIFSLTKRQNISNSNNYTYQTHNFQDNSNRQLVKKK